MMIYNFLLAMLFLLSLMFMISTHPMLMGLIIMMTTFFMTIISGLFLFSFWVSYILFLIYLGALLVLFIYMTSLSPNEMFPKNNLIQILSLMSSLLISMILYNNSYYNIIPLTMKFNKLFSSSMFPLTLMMSIFLLFSLFSIMKITKFYSGPLRMMFN